MTNTIISGVAAVLGEQEYSIESIESLLQSGSPVSLPVSTIKRLTGVTRVFHRLEGEDASDLAVKAVNKLRGRVGELKPDLLLFCSASQDLIEPATSHIVSSKLGFDCPCFDITNACNSMLNGLQVADAFIRQGVYKRVLVVSGETPSMAARWENRTVKEFRQSFAGFSMSDGGASVLLTASQDTSSGIRRFQFGADSTAWNAGTLEMGGSRAPRDYEATFFNINGKRMAQAFLSLGGSDVTQNLSETNLTWDDLAFVGIHQVSDPYLNLVARRLSIPKHVQLLNTIKDYGNMASVTLPFQLEKALETGTLKKGDNFLLIGLAGGISLGSMVATL